MIHSTPRGWKGIPRYVLDAAGVETTDDGLTFVPYRLPDGTLHNRRVFSDRGKTWWETAGTGLIPYRLEALPSESIAARCAIVLCEGESDTLAFEAAYRDRKRSTEPAYIPVGLPGALTWTKKWATYFDRFDVLYVCGDGDEPGRTMNARVAKALPWVRRVCLPDGLDVRRVLQIDRDGLAPYLVEADRLITLDACVHAGYSLDETEQALLALRVS